ncbi:MAG: CPBP family intramembrane metalloprotease [Candidatus Thorarchaeota archaeon]|nr:CPBP family intramembrane metalloprotease [Candidatus Thorarchaeota archaeon]
MTDYQKIRWLRLILFMFAMLLFAVMPLVVSILFPGELYSYVVLLTFILMYTITWAFVRWEGGESIAELGFDIDNRIGPHISIGAIAGALGVALVAAIAFFFGGQLRPFNEITGDLVINVIFNTVLFSFFEELTHRGYILTRMENLAGRRAAIIFSSLFFSLLHFSWWAPAGYNIPLIVLFSFNIFLGGVVLSLSYYWSGRRLWVPIAFHFMWNVIAYVMFPSFPTEAVVQPEIFQIEWGLTTIIGFLFGLTILWSFLASEKNKD